MMKKNSGQSGYVLLEALVAMLIFSLGLLGLIGFQAASTKIATDSRFRTEAAMLADELLAKMAASEVSQVESDYAVGGSKFKAWLDGRVKAGSRLSNVAVTPTFARSATSTGMLVTLRVEWTMPGVTTGTNSREVKGVYETTTLLF